MAKPTPQLEWLHICDYAFRDEHGKLCLIGMFDALHSATLPGRLPIFSVAIGLTDGKGKYKTALQIEKPSGSTLDLPLPVIVLQDRFAKARAVIRLPNLPFEEFGKYTFRLKLDDQPVEWPVHVIDHLQLQVQGPGPVPPAAGPPRG